MQARKLSFFVSLVILHIYQNEWKDIFAKWIVFEYQLLPIRFIFLLLFYVCDCFASVHVCRGLKRGLDPLDMEMHCVCWESNLGPP